MSLLCLDCQGIELPPSRMGERHVSVRFGDAGDGVKVYLNGCDVSDRCTEAYVGPPGSWCALMSQPLAVCESCQSKVAATIEVGDVDVVRVGG